MPKLQKRVRIPAPRWAQVLDDAVDRANALDHETRRERHRWLGLEVAARRAHWQKHPPYRGRTIALLVAIISIPLGCLCVYGGTHDSLLASALAILFFAASLVSWVTALACHIDDTFDPRVRTLEKPVCHACGYDLDGVPPALGTSSTADISIGPRHCPECGFVWPLFPPPIPGSVAPPAT